MRRMGIDYRDAKGALTRRTIVVKKVQRVGDDALVTAWCETRKAVRVFRASRMEALFNPVTGEVGDPAKTFGLRAIPPPLRSAPTSPFRRLPSPATTRRDRAAQVLAGVTACITLVQSARLVIGTAQRAAPTLKRWQDAAPSAVRVLSDRIISSVQSRGALVDVARSIEAPATLAKLGAKVVGLLPLRRR